MSKKIVIIGGVAAGASAAARLRRLDEEAEIIMFERGQDISFANCGLPYYVGGVIDKKNRLVVQTPRAMSRRFAIDVRVLTEVQEIIPAEKRVVAHDFGSGEKYSESYDYLILCPGAYPIIPDIPGINRSNVYTVRNIPDSEKIKAHVEVSDVRNVVVIGAGFIGMEMAEMMQLRDLNVAVVEASSQILGVLDPEMSRLVEKYVASKGVKFITGDIPVELQGDPAVTKVVLESGAEIPADLVIMGIGVRPETWLAEQAGLELGETGGILVDEYLQTSDPFIFAAGDAIQVKDYVTGHDTLVPMAGPANRQGWVVANNIAGRKITYPGSQGTGIIKLMDMVVAVTGRNEKTLQQWGVDYLVCHAHPNSHATYYPGSSQMSIKLIFSRPEGKILGAQIVGYDNVDKAIDALATAIRARMTVYDLQDLELAYAPPFSSAKTPVNLVGYVAGNILDGMVEPVRWEDVQSLVKEGALLVDVRTGEEFQKMPVEGAVNMPLDDLRGNLDQLSEGQEVLAFCQVGLRSYVANRILRQKGFKVKNISGGYKLYPKGK
ncbi:MAG TPA: CoA-disulfide reductase [Syntrophomonas sp.]|jgi:NADPH-dependent 2,4-dienoyl-CoA reductase/sulfur reductase-like enzyme/rhodanese-related sulfurtransferase|nr:CoA-disulfide reductase [Syntrophomonas sp.]